MLWINVTIDSTIEWMYEVSPYEIYKVNNKYIYLNEKNVFLCIIYEAVFKSTTILSLHFVHSIFVSFLVLWKTILA